MAVRGSEQAGACGGRGGRGARGQLQLRQDVRHVTVHGMRADHEALRNLRIAETLRDEPEHLPLPCTELTQRVGAGPARQCGWARNPQKRCDGAQDTVPVAVPNTATVPDPEITPANVMALECEKVTCPLSRILPTIDPVVPLAPRVSRAPELIVVPPV